MLGQVLISVIGITCVLGMTCIVISMFVPDPMPVVYRPDPRYTNCTKPQQTYSGQDKKTTTKAEIFTGKPEPPLPKINQGQFINGAWVAEVTEFLDSDSDAEFEVDDDLIED